MDNDPASKPPSESTEPLKEPIFDENSGEEMVAKQILIAPPFFDSLGIKPKVKAPEQKASDSKES